MAKGSVRKKGKKWYARFYIEDESGRKVQKEFVGTHFYRGLINEENINDSTRPRGGCFFVYS